MKLVYSGLSKTKWCKIYKQVTGVLILYYSNPHNELVSIWYLIMMEDMSFKRDRWRTLGEF